MPIQILLADDHEVTVHGMRALLERQLDFQVAAIAHDGLTALELIEQHKPEAAILDVSLPGLNGLDVLDEGIRRSPSTRFVMLSMHGDDRYAIMAFRRGALAYVLKGADAGEILEALRNVLDGRHYLGSGLPTDLIERALTERREEDDPHDSLTHREREVLQLSAEGLTSQQIGERLFISRRTVEKHRENLMSKLQFQNQSDLIRFAIRRGLIAGE